MKTELIQDLETAADDIQTMAERWTTRGSDVKDDVLTLRSAVLEIGKALSATPGDGIPLDAQKRIWKVSTEFDRLADKAADSVVAGEVRLRSHEILQIMRRYRLGPESGIKFF